VRVSPVHPRSYYRLPWTLNDNVLAWLEPTKKCNLTCKGCYSRNDPHSEKSMEQVRADLDAFTSQRTVDSISIAGGDPLTHPRVVDIVRMVRNEYDLKPVINTNGRELTRELVEQLKDAGVHGFTLHIDSGQTRKGWKGKNELELNELRLHFAKMIDDVGGLSIAFNSTVYPDTAHYVPDLIAWAGEHIDIVHSMVFILYRTMRTDEFHYYAGGEEIDPDRLVYKDQIDNPEPLTTPTLIGRVRERWPDFDAAAYLGGTVDPNTLKWTLVGRYGDGEEIFGYVGPRYMEAVQTAHHLLAGRYLAYSDPRVLGMGRLTMPALGLIDSGARRAAGSWLRSRIAHPGRVGKKVHLQTILFIQPIDMTADGSMNMCDGCPDITVHDGELVWSCRLDERLEYGCFLTGSPREADA